MVDTFKLDGAVVCGTHFDGSILVFFAGVLIFEAMGLCRALTVCDGLD